MLAPLHPPACGARIGIDASRAPSKRPPFRSAFRRSVPSPPETHPDQPFADWMPASVCRWTAPRAFAAPGPAPCFRAWKRPRDFRTLWKPVAPAFSSRSFLSFRAILSPASTRQARAVFRALWLRSLTCSPFGRCGMGVRDEGMFAHRRPRDRTKEYLVAQFPVFHVVE